MDVEFGEEVCRKGIDDTSTKDIRVEGSFWECDTVKLVSRFHTKASSEPKVETQVKATAGAVVEIPDIEPKPSVEDLTLSVEHEAVVIVTIPTRWNDNSVSNFEVLGEVLKVPVDSETAPPIRLQLKPRAPNKIARL